MTCAIAVRERTLGLLDHISAVMSVARGGRKRRVFGARKLWLRSAIEAVIGYMKTDGHLDRNLLKGRHGDHVGVVSTKFYS